MKRVLALITLFLLPVGLIAGCIFGEFGLGYRTLADKNLSDVYGSGALNFTLGVGIKVRHPFSVVVESGYYRNGGKTIGLEENTTLSYIPFMVKGRYNFVAGEDLRPYVGLGLGYIAYSIKNESEALEDVSKGSFGFEAEAGVCYKIQESMGLVVKAGYLYSKAKPFDVKRNIGGLLFSAGVRVKF